MFRWWCDFSVKCPVQTCVAEHLVPNCWQCLGGCELFADGPILEEVGYREWTLRFYSPELLLVCPRLCGDVGKQLDAPAAAAFSRHNCCRAFSVPSDCGQNWMLCPQTVSQKSNILIKLCHWLFGHSLEKNSSSAAFFRVWFLSFPICFLRVSASFSNAVCPGSHMSLWFWGSTFNKSRYLPPFVCPESFLVCLCLHLCPSLSQLHWERCCAALLCPTVAICCTPGAGSEGYFSWIIGAEGWGRFCMLLSKEGACVNAGRYPAWKWVSVCSFEMSPFSFHVLGPAPHQVCNQDRVGNASVSVWFVRL